MGPQTCLLEVPQRCLRGALEVLLEPVRRLQSAAEVPLGVTLRTLEVP